MHASLRRLSATQFGGWCYGQLPGAPQRLGTIGVDALPLEWVETKTLNFVEAVLKAN